MLLIIAAIVVITAIVTALRLPRWSRDRGLGCMSEQWLFEYRASVGAHSRDSNE